MSKETPGIKFPLDIMSNNAGYTLADLKETVRFNLKNIILTNPGERIMIPDFGVGVKRALFSFGSDEMYSNVQDAIEEQVSIYAPYVNLISIQIYSSDQSDMRISIKYEINFANITDSIDIEISNI